MLPVAFSTIGLVSFALFIKLCGFETRSIRFVRYALTAICIVFTSLFFIKVLAPDIVCSDTVSDFKGLTPVLYIAALAVLDYYLVKKYYVFKKFKNSLKAKLRPSETTKV